MNIDDATATTIEDYAHQSHAGRISFGDLVARLIELGVESYHADYRRGETTYYLPTGATHVVPLAPPGRPSGDAFRDDAIRAAIHGAQRGEVPYAEFVRLTMAAGCVGYDVWITGRQVVYHGRRGEAHVEPFPGPPT